MTKNQAIMILMRDIDVFNFVDWKHGYEYRKKVHEIDEQIAKLKQQRNNLGPLYHEKYSSEINQIREEADNVILEGLNKEFKVRKKKR